MSSSGMVRPVTSARFFARARTFMHLIMKAALPCSGGLAGLAELTGLIGSVASARSAESAGSAGLAGSAGSAGLAGSAGVAGSTCELIGLV
jgi:hypothetical protein